MAGETFIDQIESAARQSEKFRTALSGVWAFDSPVAPRIEAVLAGLGVDRR